MKELKKHQKEKPEEFKSIDYCAFHEENGVYNQGGSYHVHTQKARYGNNNNTEFQDDILF